MILKCLIPVWLSQQDCQSEVCVLTENSSDLIIHKTSPASYLSRDLQQETLLRATHTPFSVLIKRDIFQGASDLSYSRVIKLSHKTETEMNSRKEI